MTQLRLEDGGREVVEGRERAGSRGGAGFLIPEVGGGPAWARHTAFSTGGPQGPATPSLWARRNGRAMRARRAAGGLHCAGVPRMAAPHPRWGGLWHAAAAGAMARITAARWPRALLQRASDGPSAPPAAPGAAGSGGSSESSGAARPSLPPASPTRREGGGVSGFGQARQLGPALAEGEGVEHGQSHLGRLCDHQARGLAARRAEFSRVCSGEDRLGKELGRSGSLGRRE